jgi:DNA-binding IclR family transcriptional regulator
VLAAVADAPGSTAATVARATGLSASTVGATLSRLAKQGRVRRLEEGGYAAA